MEKYLVLDRGRHALSLLSLAGKPEDGLHGYLPGLRKRGWTSRQAEVYYHYGYNYLL